MSRTENTVFISYRRKDISWALTVYQFLTFKGYDVFFDYTSIPSGDFEQYIISNIKARAHFVLILTPTALDRCVDPKDWLRREIEIAIAEKRNIVPLFFDGFGFGSSQASEKLTGDLKQLTRYNGMNVPRDYFQEAMERMHTRFLSVPLEAVLHPLSADVQKVVAQEQTAANEAVQQQESAPAAGAKKTATLPAEVVKALGTQQSPNIRAGAVRDLGDLSRGDDPDLAEAARAMLEKLTADDSLKVQNAAKEELGGGGMVQPAPAATQKPAVQPAPVIEKPKPAATPPNKLTLSNGMEFMRVPAGKFLMGSRREDADARDDEKPVHYVDIPYDYWMARFPVTNELYNTYTKAKGTRHPLDGWEKKKDHPVVKVYWNDATAYCQWLNQILNSEFTRSVQNLQLRLPTEAEWEKAARGTLWNLYPWGDQFDKNKCNTSEGGKGSTTPVGTYSPQGDSPFGCADMSGNVWEWTHSLKKPYPYNVKDGREDKKASGARALRGGSSSNNVGYARCAYRIDDAFGLFSYSIGFRVALAPPLT